MGQADLWTPGPIDGAIELARTQRQNAATQRLLQPHKLQLLAMEGAASGEGVAAVGRASGAQGRSLAARQGIRTGHLLAVGLAKRHLAKEFAALGITMPTVPSVGYAFADQLHRDLLPALGNSALAPTEVDRRIAIAIVSAVNRAYTDQQLATYAAADLPVGTEMRKQWSTNKLARTAPCKHCTWLDGKMVGLNDQFPLPPGITSVYGGVLLGPPLHPNCRCRLIPRLVVT